MSENVLLVDKLNVQTVSGLASVEKWTVNRPDKLNAINAEVIARLETEGKRLKAQLAKDLTSCRGVVLCGAGDKAFVAGADIAALDKMTPEQAKDFSKKGQLAFAHLEEMPIPTLAALQGFTLGGGLELAMCCDVLVATSTAEFGQPEAYLGILPGFGAMARFVDRLGAAKAFELLCSGMRIKATEALQLKLIQRVSPEGVTITDFAISVLTEMIAKSGPLAVAEMKKIISHEKKKRYEETLQLENEAFKSIFPSHDRIEGVKAFLEKRKAQFKGA